MILAIVAAVVACFAIGTWAWRVPGIGLIGSLGGHAPGWLAVLGAAVTSVALVGDVSNAWEVTAVALGGFSAVSGLFFAWDQWRALQRHGVRARWWDFFALIPRSAGGPDDMVTYGPVAGRSPAMAVYRPGGSSAGSPVVLHIHGGAWADGNETSDSAWCRALTERGFVVFSATYTLASESTPTWDIAPREIAAAIATAARRADEFGANAERFYVTGSSAGGHLATLVANRVSAGDDLGADVGPLPTIRAVAVNIAAVDPSIDNPYWLSGRLACRIRETFVGGTPDEMPDRYDQVRSASWLHPAVPPTLLTYGPNDWLVPATGTVDYARRASALGIEMDTVAIPWTGHLIGLNGAARRAMVDLTVAWFERHRS